MYVCMSCTPVQYDTKVQVPGTGKDETYMAFPMKPPGPFLWISNIFGKKRKMG